MLVLIHVGVSLANADMIEEEVKRCCAETGDHPIGRRVYEEVGEVLLVVLLIRSYHLSTHMQVLNQALQQNAILSFQPEATNIIMIRCKPEVDARDAMRNFPLRPNESWFPDMQEMQVAYLCTRHKLINAVQSTWFATYHLDHQYIDLDTQ